jgi:hypothetical protein
VRSAPSREYSGYGLALAAAADRTTIALALASADLFAPLYGPGSARFAALAPSLDAPNLIDDVDRWTDDLKRLRTRLGAHTSRVFASAPGCCRVNVTVLSGESASAVPADRI